jgi:hypothetical protein
MSRAGLLAAAVCGALAALTAFTLLSRPAGRLDGNAVETGAAVSARIDSQGQSVPAREEPELHEVTGLPTRSAAKALPEAAPRESLVGDRPVVRGELVEDWYDATEGYWSVKPRRSSGRVRYMPVGALDGRVLIEQELVDVDRFTSEPLPEGQWIVEVRVPGCEPTVEWVRARTGPCYTVATLCSGSEVEFDVRLPDGSQPERALFAFCLQDRNESRAFGTRPEHVSETPTCLWTPDEPRVFVTVDDSPLDTAFVFVAEPSGESPYDARAPCRYVSSTIVVGAAADAPIRVQLREACMLRIAVVVPERPILELRRWVRAVRLDGCKGFDVEGLVASSREVWAWPSSLLVREEFDWYARGSPWDDDELLEARYLQPGRWHVAAGWDDQPASTSQVVEVVPGFTDAALALGQPTTTDWVRARFVVDGEVVAEPSMELEFAFVAAGPVGASRSVGGRSVRGQGGHWFERDSLAMAQREVTAELTADVPVHLVAWLRRSNAWPYAFVSAPFHTADHELVLEELVLTELVPQVARASDRRVTLQLDAQLLEPSPASRLVLSAVNLPLDRARMRVELAPGQTESPMPGKLLPGRWRFEVHASSAPPVRLEPIELQLAPGRQTLELSLPEPSLPAPLK